MVFFNKNTTPSSQQHRIDYSLVIIILTAFSLRYFNLGTPSLWDDEILHASTSHLTFPELFEYTNRFREGLMYYFFIVKIMSLFGTSELILRLPAALAGTLGVYLCFRIGELLAGRNVGYIAALMAAINLMLIGHSRQVVAYGLFFFLDSLSILFFYKTLASNFRSHAISLSLVNAAAILTYPAGFYLTVTEAALLAIMAIKQRKNLPCFKFLLFYAITSLSLLCIIYKTLAFPVDQTNGSFLSLKTDLFIFISSFSKTILEAATPWNSVNFETYVIVLILLLGIFLLRKINQPLLMNSLALVIIPGAGMYFTINGAFVFTHRLVYSLPILFVLIGIGLAFILKRFTRIAVSLAAVASAFYIFTFLYNDFYSPNADRPVLFKLAHYRQLAKELNSLVKPNSPVIFSDLILFRELRWYLSHDSESPILTQRITPGDRDFTLYFLSNLNSTGHLTPAEKESFSMSEKGRSLDPYNTLYSTVIHRISPKPPETPYSKLDVFFTSQYYFSHVYSQQNVLLKPYFGGRLVPTKNTEDCWFMYKILINHKSPKMTFGNIVYDNTVTGNQIIVEISTDGINFQPAHYAQRTGTDITDRFCLTIPDASSALYIRVKLQTEPWPPGQFLFNSDTLQLSRLQLYSCDTEQASTCDMLNIISSSPVDQKPSSISSTPDLVLDNVTDIPSQEIPGWSHLEAKENNRAGTINITILKHGTLSLYPRVGGPNDTIKVINKGNSKQLLFLAGLSGSWTPLSMRYDLPCDDIPDGTELTLEISLTGKGQLWTRNSSLIFTPAH